MKQLLIYALLLTSSLLHAQNQGAKIDKIIIEDKIFQGEIDNKYPITIYLKHYRYSYFQKDIYSLEGWYYYDKIKTKIPLVGLYDGEIVLYNFQDTSIANKLLELDLLNDEGASQDDLDYYKNMTGFKEKFVLNDSSCTWTDTKKNFSVNLYNNDFSITNTHEYLKFDDEHAFDLNNLGDWTWNFTIKAQNKNQFILEYEFDSRLSVMGVCGGGTENGFMVLKFNDEYELVSYHDFTYYSCLQSISNEEQKEINSHVTEYYCVNENDETSYTLIVDTENIEVKIKGKK